MGVEAHPYGEGSKACLLPVRTGACLQASSAQRSPVSKFAFLSMLSLCPSLAFDLLLLLHLSPSQPSFRCVSSSSRLHELCRVWLLLYVMSFVLGQGPGMLPWVALNPWALARVCTPPAGWVCVSVQSLVFPTPIPIFFLHYGNILLCARSFGDSF